jgi:hypothetical protein
LIGSREFKRDVLREQTPRRGFVREAATELRELTAAGWPDHARGLLRRLGRTEGDLAAAAKSADWKVTLAVAMRTQTIAPHRWIAMHLRMGSLYEVSRLVSAWLRQPQVKLARKLPITPNHKA